MATTIHVGNLSFNTEENDLKNFFSKYGKVTDSYIVRRGGRPRGYGFVEFDSSVSADNALAANGTDRDGRNINIEKAKGKIVKSNFSGPSRGSFNNYSGPRGGYGYNYGRDNYGRDDYGRDNYGRDNYGRDNYGRDDYGRDDYGRDGGRYNNPNRFGRQFRGRGRPMRRTFYLRPMNDGPRNNVGRRNFQRSDGEKEKSASTVYVSNLPFSIDDVQLAKLFSKYKVKTTHVVQTMNGRSRGYGFVEFETEEDQLISIKEMDNFEVKGSNDRSRNITVKVALVEKPPSNNNEKSDNE